jgi:hypothetical protein
MARIIGSVYKTANTICKLKWKLNLRSVAKTKEKPQIRISIKKTTHLGVELVLGNMKRRMLIF